jgi:hypothetical protein
MPLKNLFDKDGNLIGQAIVCTRGSQPRCGFCSRQSEKLCDYPLGNGKTCDARICPVCATHVEGKDIDYCPIHKDSVNANY